MRSGSAGRGRAEGPRPSAPALVRLDRRGVLPALPAGVVATALGRVGEVLRHLGAAGQRYRLDPGFREVAVVLVEPGLVLVDHLVERAAGHVGRADVTAALGAVLEVVAAADAAVQQL